MKLNLMALEHSQTGEESAYFEGVVLDGLDDVPEEHSGCEGVAVVDDRLAVGTVPAVQLYAAAALHQRAAAAGETGDPFSCNSQNQTEEFPNVKSGICRYLM